MHYSHGKKPLEAYTLMKCLDIVMGVGHVGTTGWGRITR